ncbi:hypothetical protein [Prosthecobacter vanneervenii]|uniref:Uncharacterized protein n=1 Tax=Prosthecobacter vanneervenii TaxID=48466 RepID=A0A7W7YGK2_9BACT|nr:hypothetical protein [Prosthecobacter vanneervenii]MBB5035709.1 hypothetical protein [Prosthecobacter vanneervenii]
MAFLFSSSHLPASRVRRPDLEDEDDQENREALPRSGGVRACSHLEGRVAEPETERSSGGSPAPRSSGAGSDWMARLKELAEQPQQHKRADSAAPNSGPRRADDEHEPDAGAEHDEDEAPGQESDIQHDSRSDSNRPPPASRLFENRPPPGLASRPAISNLVHRPESGTSRFSNSTAYAPGPARDLYLRTQGDSAKAQNRFRGYNRPAADKRPATTALLAAHAASPAQETAGPRQLGRPEPRASHEAPRQQQIPSSTPPRAAYAEEIKQGKLPPRPGRLVFDEVGPSWFGNPADLSAQAGAMGLEYAKQANPTLAQIRERTRSLGTGDIYVYSGHGGRVGAEAFLAAHGGADTGKQEVPISYDRKNIFGLPYKQEGTGYSVGQLKDDLAQGKNGAPMMVFVSGCEVNAHDMSKLNDAGVPLVVSAGGKAGERDAPGQMKTFMEVLTKGGTINDALKAVNEIVDRDNRSKFDENAMQKHFTAVFKEGITGDCTLEDLRRHNARINEERKAGMKNAGGTGP